MIDRLLNDLIEELKQVLVVIDQAERYCTGKDNNIMTVELNKTFGKVNHAVCVLQKLLSVLRQVAFQNGVEPTSLLYKGETE